MVYPSSSFENASVAAILAQRSRLDRKALFDYLVALVRRHVTSILLPLGDTIYELKRTSGETYDASRQHRGRGVVIRTDPMEIDAFLSRLGAELEAEPRHTDERRLALRQWLYSNS